MKSATLSGVSASKLDNLRREANVLKSLDYPHIAQLNETFIEQKLHCGSDVEVHFNLPLEAKSLSVRTWEASLGNYQTKGLEKLRVWKPVVDQLRYSSQSSENADSSHIL